MKKMLFACFTVFSLLLPAYAAESVREDKIKSEKVEKPNNATSPCLFRVYYPYAPGNRQLVRFTFPSPESAYKNLVSIIENMKTCTVDLKLKEHRSEKAPEKARLY